jgi:hypothetical protein
MMEKWNTGILGGLRKGLGQSFKNNKVFVSYTHTLSLHFPSFHYFTIPLFQASKIKIERNINEITKV